MDSGRLARPGEAAHIMKSCAAYPGVGAAGMQAAILNSRATGFADANTHLLRPQECVALRTRKRPDIRLIICVKDLLDVISKLIEVVQLRSWQQIAKTGAQELLTGTPREYAALVIVPKLLHGSAPRDEEPQRKNGPANLRR